MSRLVRRDSVVSEQRWQPQALNSTEDWQAQLAEAHQRAQEQADAIIAAAEAEAVEIRRRAHAEGLVSGREEGLRESEAHITAVHALVEDLNRERDEFYSRSESDLVRLAVVIAEKVLAQQLAVKPETVVDITRTYLKRIREREVVRIRLNPDDLPLVNEARQSLMAEIDGVRELQLFEDRRVGRGGVVLEVPSGTFDARFTAQVESIRKTLDDALEGKRGPADD